MLILLRQSWYSCSCAHAVPYSIKIRQQTVDSVTAFSSLFWTFNPFRNISWKLDCKWWSINDVVLTYGGSVHQPEGDGHRHIFDTNRETQPRICDQQWHRGRWVSSSSNSGELPQSDIKIEFHSWILMTNSLNFSKELHSNLCIFFEWNWTISIYCWGTNVMLYLRNSALTANTSDILEPLDLIP